MTREPGADPAPLADQRRYILEQFRVASYAPIRRLDCDAAASIIPLRGRVPTFSQKQVAQSLPQACLDPATLLKNEIEVAS